MVDKVLQETSWKKFNDDRPTDDGSVAKALAAVEKAEKSGGRAFLEALEAVEKQIAAFRKTCKTLKADKELAARLDAMEKAVDASRKEANDAAAKAAEKEDEEDSPALLTSKMIPLLREVRKGGAMHAMVALAGKDTATLVSRRAIAPARRKVLAEYLGASGGVKYVTAECIFEKNAHTFVVQSAAAGLAKKLKAALLNQTGMRLKVRVRGEDPNDIDEDLEGDDPEMAELSATLRAASDDVAKSVAKVADETAAKLKAVAEETAAMLSKTPDEAAVAAEAERAKRLLALDARLEAVRAELTRLKVEATPIAGDVVQRLDAVQAQIDGRDADAAEAGIAQLEQIAKAVQARQAGGAGAAAAAVIAAEVKELATRFVALRALLESLEAYKTPIGEDIRKRVDDVTAKLQARQPEGVAKLLDQLDQIAKAIQARKGGATAAAAQGDAKSKAREAADALLAQLNAALLAERQRLPGLTDAGLKTPVEAQLVTLEGERDKAAKTVGDEPRTAAQQKVFDAVPALTKLFDDALATQALKQAYTSARALIADQVTKADAALKATRDRFQDAVATDFEAALKADQELAGKGSWKDASDGLPTLKAAAAAVVKMGDEAEAYHVRLAALGADISTAKGVVDGGLPDGLKRLATAWTDSGAELDKSVLDKDWPAALSSLEKRKTDVIDVLKDVNTNGKPVLDALARLDADHKRANKLMVDQPTHFTPAMKPAEQKAVGDFDIALAAMNWVDARKAVDALALAIKDVLDAETAWAAYNTEFEKVRNDLAEVERSIYGDGFMVQAGLSDDYAEADKRWSVATKAANWVDALAEVKTMAIEMAKINVVLAQGAAYYSAMKSIGADMTEAFRVADLGDSRLQAQVDELDRLLDEIQDHVDADEWTEAADKVLELRDAARALVDANDGLSGKLDFEVQMGKITGLHQARATAVRPPAGLAATLPEAFRKAQAAADGVRNAKDFATVASSTATVLDDLRKATKDLLDACALLDSGRKAFEVEMKKITELAAARTIAQAAAPSLAGAISAFDSADAKAKLSSSEGRWGDALTDAQDLGTRTTELLAARGTANSTVNDETWVLLQAQLDGLAERIRLALVASTVPFLGKLQDGVRVPAEAAKVAITGKERVAAEVALSMLTTALVACEKGRTDHAAHLLKVKAATDGDVKAARDARLGSEPLNLLRTKELDVTAAEIKALADAGKIAEADKAVTGWIEEARAWLQAKDAYDTLGTSGAPDKTKLATLNALPGGGVVLDALIANLPPDTTPQSVMKDALNARYGIEVKQFKRKNPDKVSNLGGLKAVDETLPDKSLQALYEMLGDVPIDHIKDKVKELIRFTKDSGGAAYGNKKVYMYCGRSDDPDKQDFGADGGVLPPGEKVDPDCEPENKDAVPYFKFAALHEVGHAEDDAGKHMQKPEIGGMAGWLKHSSDEVAAVAAEHFGYDLPYVKAILADKGGKPPAAKPAPQGGKSPTDWEAARLKAEAWCKKVRVDKSLWYDPAGTKACAINGRVYQEAYAGDWVSYSLAARSQGISSYQFRSPVEWFADLYAAYYCKKLKSNHPAMAWLTKL